jgi:RNA polymerase sigma factor (sigma-70 family)
MSRRYNAITTRMNAESADEVMRRERQRLRNWIRRQMPDAAEVDDIVQDVFVELVQAYRSLESIENVSAWLFRVARNRIIDFFRKKKPVSLDGEIAASTRGDAEGEVTVLEDFLPALDGGPEAEYMRALLLDEVEEVLNDMPVEQREVFLAHEIEGVSFKEIAARTGVGINTLIARKHYAVERLRERLRVIYEDMQTE